MPDPNATPSSTETPNDFADVQIEASDGIFTDDEQPDDQDDNSQDAETTESDDGDPEESTDPDDNQDEQIFKIGDKEYTESDITKFIEDSTNKADWQASNTKKAQELADLRKTIEPVIQLMNKIKGKSDLSKDIRDALIEELGEDQAVLVDAALNLEADKVTHPYKEDVERLTKERDEANGKLSAYDSEKVLNVEMIQLAKDHNLKLEDAEAAKDFAIKRFTETGEIMSLETAYKAMNFDKVQEKAKKKKPTPPPPPSDGKGAKDIRKNTTPNSFEDITLDGFDLFDDT